MVTLSRGSSNFRDHYWLDLDTKKTTLVAREPSIKNEQVSGRLFDHNGVLKGFSTYTTDGPDMGLVSSFYLYNEDGSFDKIKAADTKQPVLHPLF